MLPGLEAARKFFRCRHRRRLPPPENLKILNQVIFVPRNRSYFVATLSNMQHKQRKFDISYLELRIAWIDPSREVGMGKRRESENELLSKGNCKYHILA